MRLDKIHINNFKCFENYTVEFAPRTTVLFGRNGVGKSTTISAIRKALSFVFSKGKKSKTTPLAPTTGIPSYRVENFSRKGDARRINQGQVVNEIDIKGWGTFAEQISGEWQIKASTASYKTQETGYRQAYEKFIDVVVATEKLPVLAYYSDSFPHLDYNVKVHKSIANLCNFGYYMWNVETSCSSMWVERLERAIRERQNKESLIRKYSKDYNNPLYLKDKDIYDSYSREVNAIEHALISFSHEDSFMPIARLSLDDYTGKLQIETTDARSYDFRNLPAGYRRLYNIVLDMAYRGFVLNSGLLHNQIEGVVLIDEIDLHLHPALEREVVSRFEDTFPHMQFIVTTHSPLVLVNIDTSDDKDVVLRMTTNQLHPEKVYDIYGLDYNSGVEDVMGVEAADWELQSLLRTAVYFERNNATEQFTNLCNFILRKVNGKQATLDKMLEKARKEAE